MSRFVTIIGAAEVEEGRARPFIVEGREVCVVNCGAGTFYAVDNICSHAYAELSGGELDCDELTIECPLHGSLFDLRTGAAKTLPATQPVTAYQVRVEDGKVQILLP